MSKFIIVEHIKSIQELLCSMYVNQELDARDYELLNSYIGRLERLVFLYANSSTGDIVKE
jgi:hypothetical protein